MSEQSDGQPLHIPVAAQRTVVDKLILPLLRQTGIGVSVADTKEGLNLALTFTDPPEFDGNDFGTDDPANAALWWSLKDRIEHAE